MGLRQKFLPQHSVPAFQFNCFMDVLGFPLTSCNFNAQNMPVTHYCELSETSAVLLWSVQRLIAVVASLRASNRSLTRLFESTFDYTVKFTFHYSFKFTFHYSVNSTFYFR